MSGDVSDQSQNQGSTRLLVGLMLVGLAIAMGIGWRAYSAAAVTAKPARGLNFQARVDFDSAGFQTVREFISPWNSLSLTSIRDAFLDIGQRSVKRIDRNLQIPKLAVGD